MKVQKLAALSAFLAAPFVISAPAQAAPAVHCASNSLYLVAAVERDGSVGERLIVKNNAAGTKAACNAKIGKSDFVIGSKDGEDDDAYYLLRLEGKYLLIDDGTGPDRTLLIYDLARKARVFMAGYSEEDFDADAKSASFWMSTEQKPTKQNCKDLAEIKKNDLTPAIEIRATFDFTTGTLSKSTQARCVAHQ